MNWRKSVVLKKTYRYAMGIPRAIVSRASSSEQYRRRPPVLANSFPKSGTHLLFQILESFPGTRDWGSFLASTPSFSFREIPAEAMATRARRLVPGELTGAHVYYSDQIVQSLADRHAIRYFIFRDPRDVVVSEAFYLARMNRWHKLSRVFRGQPDDAARIRLSIAGLADQGVPEYPNIALRFSRYRGWLGDSGTCTVRFESLVGPQRDEEVRRLVEHFADRSAHGSVEAMSSAAIENIEPERSHTFRSGRSGSWRDHFTDEHRQLFKEIAGDLLTELHYENDLSW